jgi:hypothetical protein
MQRGSVIRIEENVDRAASALFAVACAYAAYVWLEAHAIQPMLAAQTAAAAVFTYVLSACALSAVKPAARKLPVPVFDVREIDDVEVPELLLTEHYHAQEASSDEPLLLDDILADLGSDSRVVRLFDPASMPTPGQLKSRIDRHLDNDTSAAQSADAVQALHDALAELRRSLR